MPAGPPSPATPGTGRSATLVGIFVAALLLRLLYLRQVARTPWFDDPLGDSLLYYQRAREILAGHWLGNEISFHSSPIYPYFVAFWLELSGGRLFILGVVQICIGAANCVLIALLAQRLADGRQAAAMVAGASAAAYGMLAFFDADVLMIFLTLFFADLALLLLLCTCESDRRRWPLLAGTSLGLAALDKTNILLFAPVAVWWLAREVPRPRRWTAAAVFLVGVSVIVLPVTARNLIVGHDLVFVSSNAGVNLFIGNNPEARGVFYLPPASGLDNVDLYGSSVRVAGARLGRTPKPSEASRYWADQAWTFALAHPRDEARLIGRKMILLVNAYEVPNHLDFYFVRARYAPALATMFVSFGLVVPIALVGVGWRVAGGLGTTDRLYVGFLAAYVLSLVPFFVSERYRLPVVPVLIAFAAVTVVDVVRVARARRYWLLAALIAATVGAAMLVNWPLSEEFDYTFMQKVIAEKELAHAAVDPRSHARDVRAAILDLKEALEVDSRSAAAHANLGTAYALAGFRSGAVREWETALALDARMATVRPALETSRAELARQGDDLGPRAIPRTTFERAKELESAGRHAEALQLYEATVLANPYHGEAVFRIAGIYYARGDLDSAAKILRRGLEKRPENVLLLNNLGFVRFEQHRYDEARVLWQECLRLVPASEVFRKQLQMIPAPPGRSEH